MDWQLLLAWLAIAVASGYVLLRIGRSLRGTKSGCGRSCGCPKAPAEVKTQLALIKPEQLKLRQRR